MSDYDSKLSVGFLTKKQHRVTEPQKKAEDFLEEAVMLYGRLVLESLAATQDGREHLHKIVRDKKIPIGDALQLVERLEKLGLIEILQKDDLGNHLLALLQRGRAMVS